MNIENNNDVEIVAYTAEYLKHVLENWDQATAHENRHALKSLAAGLNAHLYRAGVLALADPTTPGTVGIAEVSLQGVPVICPQCEESYYVASQGFLEDGAEAWQCDLCNIAWLIPPATDKSYLPESVSEEIKQ